MRRRELMKLIYGWRNGMGIVRYKDIEMPFRNEEIAEICRSSNKVKRKLAMKYKSHLRKGRIVEGVNEKGEKTIKKTSKYAVYRN